MHEWMTISKSMIYLEMRKQSSHEELRNNDIFHGDTIIQIRRRIWVLKTEQNTEWVKMIDYKAHYFCWYIFIRGNFAWIHKQNGINT